MAKTKRNTGSRTLGYLSLTLHAHLPYVLNHGTWPHGMEWLLEAAAETYLPLLRVLGNLERDDVPFRANVNLSPVLLEQLSHPLFVAEFPRYLNRKITAAGEDEAYFVQSGEDHLAGTARYWKSFYTQALEQFRGYGEGIVGAFRHFNDVGLIDVITSSATHGYLPLLGTDESIRAQIKVACATHVRHFGKAPLGIWSPECGYRPAGYWEYPLANTDGGEAGFQRAGLDEIFAESGLGYFFVDTHLVENAHHVQAGSAHDGRPSLYRPHAVGQAGSNHATVFPRDPRTAVEVWSSETGYPGDFSYLEFHKKRWPGGHRYWRITGDPVAIHDKQPYAPEDAVARVKAHADHFVSVAVEALKSADCAEGPPILTAPFDAELFGHWWFEGPLWLETVARTLAEHDTGLEMLNASEYLKRHQPGVSIAMAEGSWGSGGAHQVWMNPETSWTYTHLYPAELYVREAATNGPWRGSAQGRRILQQLCRELMLMESSDWQTLITTGAARDYAEGRFVTHHDQFNEVKVIWHAFATTGAIGEKEETRLAEIEKRDSIFPDIDPEFWTVQEPAQAGARVEETTTA